MKDSRSILGDVQIGLFILLAFYHWSRAKVFSCGGKLAFHLLIPPRMIREASRGLRKMTGCETLSTLTDTRIQTFLSEA